MSFHAIPRFAGAVGLLSLILSGCGSKECHVSGEVTFDGKPVDNGVIVFEPPEGAGQTSGTDIVDGFYELPKNARVTSGKNIVRIQAFHKTGRKVSAKPAPGLVDEMLQIIPPEYNQRSTLTADIQADKVNVVNFNLKKKP
jgi:hypothetical protein